VYAPAEAAARRPGGGQADGHAEPAAPSLRGGVGVAGGQLPPPAQVRGQDRPPLGARRARGGFAGRAPPRLEAAAPGLTAGILGGDGTGRPAAVASGRHALASVEGVGSPGILRGAEAIKSAQSPAMALDQT